MVKCLFRFCAQSKPTILILLFSTIVGALRSAYSIEATNGVKHNSYLLIDHQIVHLISIIISSLAFSVLALFYPVGGFIADTTRSRYRIIITGVGLIWIALATTLVSAIPVVFHIYALEDVLVIAAVVLFMIGLSCFSSNIIQFGFDQLLDMPSYYLSMFVHWYVWSDLLGGFVSATLNNVNHCYEDHYTDTKLQPLVIAFYSLLFLLLTVHILVGWFFNKHKNV